MLRKLEVNYKRQTYVCPGIDWINEQQLSGRRRRKNESGRNTW